MRRWLLALTLLAAAAPLAAVEPVAAIDACERQLDRELDVGYARVAQRCPDLADDPWHVAVPDQQNGAFQRSLEINAIERKNPRRDSFSARPLGIPFSVETEAGAVGGTNLGPSSK